MGMVDVARLASSVATVKLSKTLITSTLAWTNSAINFGTKS